MLYYTGMITKKYLDEHSTEKAFFSSYDDGRYQSNRNKLKWFPKSICKFGEPNDIGWMEICIPEWFFRKNQIEYKRCIDIQWKGFEEL